MDIKVPDLGVESAEVSEIMVKVGDVINVDDNIVLLESDKASVEVPAPQAGKVTQIVISVGDQVKQGDILLSLAEDNLNSTVEDSAQADKADSSATSQQQDGSSQQKNSSNTNLASQSNHVTNADSKSSASSTAQSANNLANHSSNNQTTKESANYQETTYKLPDLGVDEAQVSEWLIKIGEYVNKDQPVLLVESDKAAVEVPAPVSGTVVTLLVETGATVASGQDFIIINAHESNRTQTTTASHNEDTDTNSKTAETKPIEPAQQVNSPVNTSQSTTVNQAQVSTADSFKAKDKSLDEAQINADLSDIYAGPAVRKLTRQLGVDITQVKGRGQHGRIVKEDIFDYVKQRMQADPKPIATDMSQASGLPPLPDMSNNELWGETDTQALSRLQKVSIPQLTYNTYLPQVTQFDLSDITETEALRQTLKTELKPHGISLTILAFVMKAVAYALLQYPKFNSHLSDDQSHIIVRKSINMGFAVATDDGLIVPVITNIQDKGIKAIASAIHDLANKARDKKLTVKELTGASFTISSQGNLGGTYFTPLVNWPQVAILGVSESSLQPRWNETTAQFEPRLMLPLSLSYDHRVINGADAAVFTRFIAQLLADPRRILL